MNKTQELETVQGLSIDEIQLGQTASCTRVITDEDVRSFAELSGDRNPVHLDEEYAKGSRFKKRIAHGFLSASLFSALFGTKIPGRGCVYISQSLEFKRPVYLGDTVEATVVVTSIDKEKSRVSFDTFCKVKNKIVISGKAELFLP